MLNEQQPLKHINPVCSVILLISVLALIGIGIYHTYPPSPSPLSAPESTFSSARAMTHVRQIAAHPHPTGSLENENVRQYLLTQLKELGLEPEIQSSLVVNPKTKQVGRIHNVLARIQGVTPGKALLLAAHYDSVKTGPGAADDGASVAAILETLRALKTQTALRNDLICLFTDSEEMGLLGAEAFVQQHPWVKNTGMALNFEYRGNRGAFMMFETSEGNGKLIEGLATAVPFVMTNSLMYEVYKRLPNDTDFSVLKRAGIPGMNFAAIAGHNSYHTQLDRPELLDQGTVQHEGEIMLALVKHFGNQPLDNLTAENHIYFDFPGLGVIHYPMNWAVALCGLLVVLFAALCVAKYKAKLIRPIPLLTATLTYPVLIFVLYNLDCYLWYVIRLFHRDYKSFAYDDTFTSYCYLLGFIFLNIALSGGGYLVIKKWVTNTELFLGIAVCWLLMALFTYNNGANFLFYWPLLAMLFSLILATLPFIKNHPRFIPVILLLGSVPGLLIFTPLIKNLFIGLTPSYIGIILVFLGLLLGLLSPVMAEINSNKTSIILSALIALFGFILGSYY